MCANRIQGTDEDNFKCNKKCDEYIEFVALPIYEAAPDMYEACLSALGLLAVENPGELPKIMEQVKTTLIKALRKAEGKEG